MMTDFPVEAHSQKNDLAIEELSIRIEAIDRDVEELFKELNVTQDQLSAFLNNESHFSKENWETLIQERKILDEKLLKELVNISNPIKTKKKYTERNVQSHWLFVR